MVKNITFSIDEKLLQQAREASEKENTTLNETIVKLLDDYVKSGQNAKKYRELMKSFSYAKPGKHFNREELNER